MPAANFFKQRRSSVNVRWKRRIKCLVIHEVGGVWRQYKYWGTQTWPITSYCVDIAVLFALDRTGSELQLVVLSIFCSLGFEFWHHGSKRQTVVLWCESKRRGSEDDVHDIWDSTEWWENRIRHMAVTASRLVSLLHTKHCIIEWTMNTIAGRGLVETPTGKIPVLYTMRGDLNESNTIARYTAKRFGMYILLLYRVVRSRPSGESKQ